MSTSQIMHGISSLEITRVTPELFSMHSGQFLFMIQEYYKSSSDRSSDPISMFNRTRERLSKDDSFMMLAPMSRGIPVGFLAADVIRDAARILIGFINEDIKPAVRNVIIDRVMAYFEEWARAHKCRVEIFYTHRVPGAHKFMIKRGWEYDLAIYKKEIAYG